MVDDVSDKAAIVLPTQAAIEPFWEPNKHSAKAAGSEPDQEESERLVIVVNNRQIKDISRECRKALKAYNEMPKLYVRAGGLVHITKDENDTYTIEEVSPEKLKYHLRRAAYFVTVTNGKMKNSDVVAGVVHDILASRHRPYPKLRGLTRTPILRSDGTIVTDPGYDASSRLYYAPPRGFSMPNVPETPTQEQIKKARNLLDEAIIDIPFDSEKSKANYYALLFTLVLRPIIDGQVPMALLDAPQAGTGKSLLANLAAIIATGERMTSTSVPNTDKEWGNTIASVLREGSPYVCFDNVIQPIKSGNLESAITSSQFSVRLMMTQKTVKLPVRITWIASGNNIVAAKDLWRRCYQIRLVASVEKPSEKKGFKHEILDQWAKEKRGDLLAALLTLVRSWYAAGQPKHDTPAMGSFEEWVSIVGSILAHNGIVGFAPNMEKHDPEDAEWAEFLRVWHDHLAEEAVTVKDLLEKMDTCPNLLQTLPEDLGKKTPLQFGMRLRNKKDAVFGQYQLMAAGMDGHSKVAKWCVRKIAGGAGDCGE